MSHEGAIVGIPGLEIERVDRHQGPNKKANR